MALSSDQADQLVAAGTVQLPPNSPEVGILYRAFTPLPGAVVCVEQRVSDFQVNRYFVRIREVKAVLDTLGRRRRSDFGDWYFGREARTFLEGLLDETQLQAAQQQAAQQQAAQHPGAQQQTHDPNTYGIIFVRKSAGVLVQTDRAISADEVDEQKEDCCFKDEDNGYGDCC